MKNYENAFATVSAAWSSAIACLSKFPKMGLTNLLNSARTVFFIGSLKKYPRFRTRIVRGCSMMYSNASVVVPSGVAEYGVGSEKSGSYLK